MKNLELKVKCVDHKAALRAVKLLKARDMGTLNQRDVYFNISPGRLKLRSINDSVHQLIYYKRANRAAAKFSNYYISEIIHPKRVEHILKEIYGIKVIVSKRRKLYLWQNVRIHIDSVKELGKYLEFEILCRTAIQQKRSAEIMKYLKKIFNIKNSEILSSSYSDMMKI
ncbi:MAG TPA: class IV adenylate cyclase [Ignavibacteria bacterium]|nr:class IV adenylate cyclase [Ignavibacteria bacterium]HMQ98668.1 class IV adenylate cyclase [Ignavibacteria bacterium]